MINTYSIIKTDRDSSNTLKRMPKLSLKNKFKKVKVLKGLKINPKLETDKGNF